MLTPVTFATAVVGLSPHDLFATNKTYIGAAGTGNWSTVGNRTPFGVSQFFDNAYLVPSDSSNRTVIFDTNSGSFLFKYGGIAVAATGSGSITLRNASLLFADFLTIGKRGE